MIKGRKYGGYRRKKKEREKSASTLEVMRKERTEGENK